MKTRAVSMVLLMIASALAGCTSGDPDGDGEMGIDTDVLNQMIEDNLQDFINNSSVTVHQTIHYHNNTTYVVDDGDYSTTNHAHFNNTTNVDGGEVVNNHYNTNHYNSSLGGGDGNSAILHGIDFEFNLNELWGNEEVESGQRTNEYNVTWSYYDYLTNDYRNDTFTFSCGVYYLVGSANSSNIVTYWENNNYYDQAWDDNGYNGTMRDIFNNFAWDSELRFACDESFYGYDSGNDYYAETIYTITVPEGYAFSCRTYAEFSLLYRTGNTSEGGYYEWSRADWSSISIIIDGILTYEHDICVTNSNDANSAWYGNGESFEINLRYGYLNENHEYRLMFNYELRPVVTTE